MTVDGDLIAHEADGRALALGPILSGMVNTRDFNCLSIDLIYDDER